MTIHDIDKFLQWQHPYYDEDDEHDDLGGWWRLHPDGGFRAYKRIYHTLLTSDEHFAFDYPGVQDAKLTITDYPFSRYREFRLTVVLLEFDRVDDVPSIGQWYAACKTTHYKKVVFGVQHIEPYCTFTPSGLNKHHAAFIVDRMCDDMAKHLDGEQRPGRFLLRKVDMRDSVYRTQELLFNPNRVVQLQGYA